MTRLKRYSSFTELKLNSNSIFKTQHVSKSEKKPPVVRIDKSLNKYSNVVLFPEKVEKAKQAFEKMGLPKKLPR